MTGALLKIDIRGRDGLTLREKWAAGPRTYLGLQVAGFPNLFTITGPGSPSVLTQHDGLHRAARRLDRRLHRHTLAATATTRIEAEPRPRTSWVGHVNEVADTTLSRRCNSWYLGANIPGKPRVFMPYIGFPP